MYLEEFNVFLTVVEEMNFTRAAERLYITQQALSGHIRRLEEHYGVTLFRRRPTLKLTAEGEAMVLCARSLMDSEDALTRRLADITQNASAVLNFGISYQRSDVFFPGVWNRFREMHPNIRIRLNTMVTDKLMVELQSGREDLIVGLDIVETSALKVIPMVEEHVHCVLSEALLRRLYPDRWRELLDQFREHGADLAQLRDAPMLLLPGNNRIRVTVDRLFLRDRVLPNVMMECANQSVLFRAACCSSGVAIINPISIYQEIRQFHDLPPGCHSFPVRGAPVSTVSLAFRKDVPQPQYVLDLAQCVQEEFLCYSSLLETHRL